MNLNGSGRQELERQNSWQLAKHAKLYSGLPVARQQSSQLAESLSADFCPKRVEMMCANRSPLQNNQSTNQSINRPINQSINQSINKNEGGKVREGARDGVNDSLNLLP